MDSVAATNHLVKVNIKIIASFRPYEKGTINILVLLLCSIFVLDVFTLLHSQADDVNLKQLHLIQRRHVFNSIVKMGKIVISTFHKLLSGTRLWL